MITIIDYKLNNLSSLCNSLNDLNIEYTVASSPAEVGTISKFILPGVGAFPSGMKALKDSGWDQFLIKNLDENSKLLGICLGMQLLFEKSNEIEETSGLGIIKGRVCALHEKTKMNTPHIGWNSLNLNRFHPILKNINSNLDVYFLHSYYCVPLEASMIFATTDYGIEFPSIVIKNNIVGVQFHPEKSQRIGSVILKNFSEW